jgi:hypothetical protein
MNTIPSVSLYAAAQQTYGSSYSNEISGGAQPVSLGGFDPKDEVSLSPAALNGQDAAPPQSLSGEISDALKALTLDGLSANNVNYNGSYKQELFQIADVSGDGVVSEADLENQVLNGGGTKADADALYGAVDTDGSNGVTAQQFSGALATPVDNNFGNQLLKALDPNGASPVTMLDLEQLLMQNGKTEEQAQAIATEINLA